MFAKKMAKQKESSKISTSQFFFHSSKHWPTHRMPYICGWCGGWRANKIEQIILVSWEIFSTKLCKTLDTISVVVILS